jgi:hypothetical protein
MGALNTVGKVILVLLAVIGAGVVFLFVACMAALSTMR